MRIKQKQSLGHEELYTSFRKGLRNGNWRKLNFLDKALYRASLWYAKHRCIINGIHVETLLGLVARLEETKGMRKFKYKRGFERAAETHEKGEEKGVFVWVPSVKDWLKTKNGYVQT
ncbi:hypothetical protein C5S32_01155 [ANME-1 cluster archaeon GoMg1]|nr:hypothetical protein [ANME-1 cluster archaeon GoMg1]